jgi:hypothetical protein
VKNVFDRNYQYTAAGQLPQPCSALFPRDGAYALGCRPAIRAWRS